MVNHPPHYADKGAGFQCIDVTRLMGFDLGCAVKYMWRRFDKNGIEDVRKARWYVLDYMRHDHAVGSPNPAADGLRRAAQHEPVGSYDRAFYFALSHGKIGEALDVLDAIIADHDDESDPA
jgi:hypothetical protein